MSSPMPPTRNDPDAVRLCHDSLQKQSSNTQDVQNDETTGNRRGGLAGSKVLWK